VEGSLQVEPRDERFLSNVFKHFLTFYYVFYVF